MILSKAPSYMALTNRGKAQRGFGERPYGRWLDEYPFASTNEGGEGASVRLVPKWEQLIQATQIRVLHRNLNVNDRYLIMPINKRRFKYKEAPAYMIRDIENPERFVPGREYIVQPNWLNRILIDWKSERYKLPPLMPPVLGPSPAPALSF